MGVEEAEGVGAVEVDGLNENEEGFACEGVGVAAAPNENGDDGAGKVVLDATAPNGFAGAAVDEGGVVEGWNENADGVVPAVAEPNAFAAGNAATPNPPNAPKGDGFWCKFKSV